jgi:hypothetical protein
VSLRRSAPLVVGLGLLASQAGHLLAYQVMLGAAAQHAQSTGAHSYFPLVAKTAAGTAVAALIAGLLMVGLARVLRGRRIQSSSEPSYVSLLAFLFCIQLAAFAAQEVGEALVAGMPVPTAAQLLLWGTLGQLPVAAMAALALRWLCVRVESAVGAIREIVRAGVVAPPAIAPVSVAVFQVPDQAPLLSGLAGSALAKRGPPSSLLIAY